MSIEKFKNLRFFFHLIRVDSGHEENCHFLLGNQFNIEGYLILSEVEQINLLHKSCQNCKNFIYIDIKKLFTVSQIGRIWDEICAGKKEQIKKLRTFWMKICQRPLMKL